MPASCHLSRLRASAGHHVVLLADAFVPFFPPELKLSSSGYKTVSSDCPPTTIRPEQQSVRRLAVVILCFPFVNLMDLVILLLQFSFFILVRVEG